jgi:Family of unknown function (DUF5994)
MATLKGSSTDLVDSPPDQVGCPGRGPTQGSIDGGWWPRTLDLAMELPPLIEHMFAAGFDITDVSYNLDAWLPAPHHLNVSRRRVYLHGNVTQDVASIHLTDSTGLKPVVVVVIPPSTRPLVAENALALAGRDGDRHRPDQILPRAQTQTAADDSRRPEPSVRSPRAAPVRHHADPSTDGRSMTPTAEQSRTRKTATP